MKYLTFSILFLQIACTNAEDRAYNRLKTETERKTNCSKLAECLNSEGSLGMPEDSNEWECTIFNKQLVNGEPAIFTSIKESHLRAAIWGCKMGKKYGTKKY